MDTSKIKKSQIYGLVIISFFLIFRMAFEPLFWRTLPAYYSYLFESFFVLIVGYLFRKRITLAKMPSFDDLGLFIFSLAFGFCIFKIAGYFNIIIPFDFKSIETALLILFLAPVLEEAVFRLALWEGFKELTKNRWIIIATTSILFSLGHFTAYWFVPQEYHSFVIYQTFYTLLLGIMAGWSKEQSRVLSTPVLVHFCFNLGFFLAAW